MRSTPGKMDRLQSKLVSFLSSVTNTRDYTNTLAYHAINKSLVSDVFMAQARLFVLPSSGRRSRVSYDGKSFVP
jgi:hypothetical protein